jgi:DNA polymerase-3 subunit epsilon
MWARLFGGKVALAPDQAARLDRWRALPEPDLRAPAGAARLVVVDTETTGLDAGTDRVIAIGAVTVEAGKIDLGRAYYAILRQSESSSRDNILVHGIGGTAQRTGDDPAEVLLGFLEFAGKAPLVGFHARFDDAMLRRASREHLGASLPRRWIDLAEFAPRVLPAEARRRKALDEWLALFGIEAPVRHDAAADALATAQLLLALLVRSPKREATRVASMLSHAGGTRWLTGN